MDLEQGQSYEGEERSRWLRTYLRDHTVGAEHAIQLLRALRDSHEGTILGQFATDELQQIEKDLSLLEDLASRIGSDGFQVKELAGWFGDKLSRLKLAPLESPFGTFEALEFLSLGILGKRALWRTLMSVAFIHPELQGTDFPSLLERAEAQYLAMERCALKSRRMFLVRSPAHHGHIGRNHWSADHELRIPLRNPRGKRFTR